jgi:hypothetical protein
MTNHIIESLLFSEYLDAPGVNWSTLKHMDESALSYKHHLDHPKPETDAMRLGRATHTAVLDPDSFLLEYVLYPGKDRCGNKWKDFVADHDGKTVLLEKDYQQCLAIRDAVRGHPVAGAMIDGGSNEVSAFWTDKTTGLKCKGRIDHIGYGALVDLKTTGQFEPRLFAANAARLGYHKQLAFYRDGLRRAWPGPIERALIIAVQQPAPHDVAVYTLSDELLDHSRKEVAELMLRLEKCQRKDEWPGVYSEAVELELPLWAYPDEEPLTQGGEVI